MLRPSLSYLACSLAFLLAFSCPTGSRCLSASPHSWAYRLTSCSDCHLLTWDRPSSLPPQSAPDVSAPDLGRFMTSLRFIKFPTFVSKLNSPTCYNRCRSLSAPNVSAPNTCPCFPCREPCLGYTEPQTRPHDPSFAALLFTAGFWYWRCFCTRFLGPLPNRLSMLLECVWTACRPFWAFIWTVSTLRRTDVDRSRPRVPPK